MKPRRTKRIDRRNGLVRIKSSPRAKARTTSKPKATKKAAVTKKADRTARTATAKKPATGKIATGKSAATKNTTKAVAKKPTPRMDDRRLQAALVSLREGKTAAATAREIGVTPKILTDHLDRTRIAKWTGKQWAISKTAPRQWTMPSNGQMVGITVGNKRASKAISSFLNHVHAFSESNNPNDVSFFRGHYVTDISGKRHPFETEPDVLRELLHTADPYEQIYRIVAPQ